MWGYVSGISGKPEDKKAENYVDLLDVWEANNSKLITWVNNSVEHSIGTQLTNPLPSVDSVVSGLLAEEIHLKSQAGNGILPAPNPSSLAVSSKPPSNFENKRYSKVGIDECSFCKQKGHWKTQYPKLSNKAQQSQPQQQYQQKYQQQSP
ncbi:hypothetical protein LWI28_003129 [Acer negundo]|uniref:Uncharacterized protein n=1 Tax=Acer negundo TaxID=4023 RepID=A0AAD5ISZ9_ACENE|nr:hypothetical protein LWI28_003129 [Acer negundo]